MRNGRFFHVWAVVLGSLLLSPLLTKGQQIIYSNTKGDNIQSTSFDIIGKYGNNLLVYKKSYDDYTIEMYDPGMKLVNEVPLDFLPDQVKDVDFISLPAQILMICQYIEKRDIYCSATLLDSLAQPLQKPVLIDKTTHPFQVIGDETYAFVTSGDKSKMLIFKILRNDDSLFFQLHTFLFDSTLALLNRGTTTLPFVDPDQTLEQCTLSDKGGFYFLFGPKSYNYDPYYQRLKVYYKPPFQNKLFSEPLPFEDHLPYTTLLMTADNDHQKLWVNTFNYGSKQHHINYLCTFQLGFDSLKLINKTITLFNDSLRQEMQDKRRNLRQAFDNFHAKTLVINKNGGALLVAEKSFTDANNQVHYGDLGFFDLGPEGELLQLQKIEKDQGPDLGGTFDSFLMINNGRALHFLLNKSHRVFRFLNNQIYLLRDYRYNADHELKEMRVMRKLDNKYRWAPRYGKQISHNEVVIPCVLGSNLFFGKITF